MQSKIEIKELLYFERFDVKYMSLLQNNIYIDMRDCIKISAENIAFGKCG